MSDIEQRGRLYPPTFIAVAPNGGRRTKAQHPALPITAEECAQVAREAQSAGAAMIHLHVRDAQGRHSLDPGRYREAIAAVRDAVGPRMVVQITTESIGMYAPDEQVAVVKAVKPEAVSVALREIAPNESDAKRLSDLLAFCEDERIAPQIIAYDRTDADRLARWAHARVVDGRQVSVLFVGGRYDPPTQARPADLVPMIESCADVYRDFMVCAFGPREAGCGVLAGLLGGHVRCGFENNLALPDGSPAQDNAAVVAAQARALSAAGLTLGDAIALRSLWGIEGR
ncbi:3-keto-5-aminohexanoate cleavage protein [Salinarimonas ramus]|uniref:3-keto-5-aminohexanoate cleavage enzyme n=1 Tax=Salinarimonas ramus TaxID=690164 RepID=A0A917Q465_9HYPH|nr:3-keto-5-aminohexanoate cleavage protein [Salinarimonas ramus]GGK22831.1 3-keto-5-aminohexanoate cleavage enzyme [Salinarimonas ramus]